jgi:hypothetical protein
MENNMKTHRRIDIIMCYDCVVMIANGDGEDSLLKKINENWGKVTRPVEGIPVENQYWELIPGDEEGYFSGSGCDCCGSTFQGMVVDGVALLLSHE